MEWCEEDVEVTVTGGGGLFVICKAVGRCGIEEGSVDGMIGVVSPSVMTITGAEVHALCVCGTVGRVQRCAPESPPPPWAGCHIPIAGVGQI